MKRVAREQVVKDTLSLMTSISSEVAAASATSPNPPSPLTTSTSPEEVEPVNTTSDKIDELCCLSKNFGPTNSLSDLNIIDLTEHNVFTLYKEKLSKDEFDEVNSPYIKPWKEEFSCKKLLDALCREQVDPRDLREIIRTPVIDPKDYHPGLHYDLRTIKNVAGSWIDLMGSPANPLKKEHGERTSALDGVILILKNLFRQFNDIVHMRWIEVGDDTAKRHKWDGLISKFDRKATIMPVKFAGGFTKIYRNAARLLNKNESSPHHQPCVFVVLSHNYKVYLECITFVTDRAYVRAQKAVMDVPYSHNGLKRAMEQFPGVFAWINTVISSVKEKVPVNIANIKTIPVPDTP